MLSAETVATEEIVATISVFLIIYSTAIALAFVVTYQAKAQWWKTTTGRAIMTLWFVISAVFVLSTVRQFVDADSLAFLIFRMLVFAGVPCVLTWHYVILVRAQRQARKDRRNGKSSGPE